MTTEQSLMLKLAQTLNDEELGLLSEIMAEGDGTEKVAADDSEIGEIFAGMQAEAASLSNEELAEAIKLAAAEIHPERQDELVKAASADIAQEQAEVEYWETAGRLLFRGLNKEAARHVQYEQEEQQPEHSSLLLTALGL